MTNMLFPCASMCHDEVGNGVALAGSRRSLHQDCTGFFQSVEHTLLLGIGSLREQEVDFFCFRFIPLGPSTRVNAHYPQQGFGKIVLLWIRRTRMSVDLNKYGVFDRGKCRKLPGFNFIVEVLSVAPESLDDILKEITSVFAAKGRMMS